MPSIVDHELLTINSPAKLGNLRHQLSVAENPASSPWREGGIVVLRHKVPAGQRLTCEAINIWAVHSALASSAFGGTATGTLGIFKARVTGVDKMEWRLINNPGSAISGVGHEDWPAFMQSTQHLLDFSDGITFTSAETVEFTITPENPNWASVYFVTAVGKLGATTEIRKGVIICDATTANQAILSYTPPSDWTLFSIKVEAVFWGTVIAYGLDVFLNGAQIAEFGGMSMSDAHTSFCSEYEQPGVLSLPLNGMTIADGDVLTVVAHPVVNGGQKIGAMLIGSESAIGGAGGGLLTHPGMHGGMRG
jgi:hypothetical protein